MKILVLGAGRMGLGAVYDLAHNSSDVDAITVADIDLGRARAVVDTVGSPKVIPVALDVANYDQVVSLMTGHDSTLSCVVYSNNLRLAKAAIDARSNFCDLGGNNSIVRAEEFRTEKAIVISSPLASIRPTATCSCFPSQ